MRFLIFYLVFNCLACAEDWKTSDGKVYLNVKILSKDNAYVTILDRDGGGKILISSLSPEIQKSLQYDPTAAKSQLVNEQQAIDEEVREKAASKILYAHQLTAKGKIIQVLDNGIILSFIGISTQTHIVAEPYVAPPSEDQVRTIGIQLAYRDREVPYGINEERAFIPCNTTGLADNDHWEGIVWRNGTYSYQMVVGSVATIPKYTTDRKEAYAALMSSSVSTTNN
jgi:hypothetical protein